MQYSEGYRMGMIFCTWAGFACCTPESELGMEWLLEWLNGLYFRTSRCARMSFAIERCYWRRHF